MSLLHLLLLSLLLLLLPLLLPFHLSIARIAHASDKRRLSTAMMLVLMFMLMLI